MNEKKNEKLDAAIVADVLAAQDDSMYRYEDTCNMIDEIYDEMLVELRNKVREKFDKLGTNLNQRSLDKAKAGAGVAAFERNGLWYTCPLGKMPEDPAKLAEWLAGSDLNLDDCPEKDALTRLVVKSRRLIHEEAMKGS